MRKDIDTICECGHQRHWHKNSRGHCYAGEYRWPCHCSKFKKAKSPNKQNKADRKKAELFANMLYRALKPYFDYKGS